MATFDSFNEVMEGYEVAAAESRGYDKLREETKELQRRNEVIKKQTGVDPKLVNKNDPKIQAAGAAKKRLDFYTKTTADYMRGNLEGILGEAESSRLVASLRSVPAKSEDYKDLAGLIADYQMYMNLAAPIGRDEKEQKKNAESAMKRFSEKLPGIIQKQMMAKGASEEKAKVEAEYLALVANKDYTTGLIEEELKAVTEKLEGTSRETIASYLKSVFKKDEDYIGFGTILYLTHKEENKKAA